MTLIDYGNDQHKRTEFIGDGLHGDDWSLVVSSPARRKAASPFDVELVGRSQAFIDAMKQVERVSNNNQPVLLTGEQGTGKALVALAIHHGSGRADQPFVTVNCGERSEESIEAELFGTGRMVRRRSRTGSGFVKEEGPAGTRSPSKRTKVSQPVTLRCVHMIIMATSCTGSL